MKRLIRAAESSHSIEFETPENILLHIRLGHISVDDFQQDLSKWKYLTNATIDLTPKGYFITVSDLSEDAYDEVESFMEDWLEGYSDTLDDEFGEIE